MTPPKWQRGPCRPRAAPRRLRELRLARASTPSPSSTSTSATSTPRLFLALSSGAGTRSMIETSRSSTRAPGTRWGIVSPRWACPWASTSRRSGPTPSSASRSSAPSRRGISTCTTRGPMVRTALRPRTTACRLPMRFLPGARATSPAPSRIGRLRRTTTSSTSTARITMSTATILPSSTHRTAPTALPRLRATPCLAPSSPARPTLPSTRTSPQRACLARIRLTSRLT